MVGILHLSAMEVVTVVVVVFFVLVAPLLPTLIYARKGHQGAAVAAFLASALLPCLGWTVCLALALMAPVQRPSQESI